MALRVGDDERTHTSPGSDSDAVFNDIVSHNEGLDRSPAATAMGDQMDALDRDGVQGAEDSAGSGFNYSPGDNAEHSERNLIHSAGKRSGGGAKRTLALALAGGVSGIAIVMFLIATTTSFAFLEKIMPDLNTAVGSLFMAKNTIMLNKFLYTSKAVKGCTVLSMRCKLSTFSKAEIDRFEKAGIKINGAEEKKLFGRVVNPDSIEFQGKSMNPQEYIDAKLTNPELRAADNRGTNMKYLGSLTNRFTTWVLGKFGVNKSAPGLKGSQTDRINQLLTASSTDSLKNVSFEEIKGAKADNGDPLYKLVGDTSDPPRRYTVKERADIETLKLKKPNPTLEAFRGVQSSSAFTGVLKAVSITGWADIGCSLYKLVGATAVGAKSTTLASLIGVATPIFSLMQKIKSQDPSVTSDDVDTVAALVTKVDDRKEIYDTNQGKLVPNPNYGMTPLNSVLVNMSESGKLGSITSETTQFSAALSLAGLLGPFYPLFQSTMSGIISGGGCDFIQNFAVRGASLIIGIIAAVGTGGTELAASAGLALAMMGGMAVVQVALSAAIHGPDILSAFNSGSAESVGSALWLAAAGLTGTQSATLGMVPGNYNEIKTSQAALKEATDNYAEMDKMDAQKNPFDVYNQYSFAGIASRQVASLANYQQTPLAAIRASFALLTGKGTTNYADTAYASTDLSSDRFSKCDDEAYKKMGVSPDAACNLRYVMMPEDIAKLKKADTATVVPEWMESNGYVETNTLTGLPAGYSPPDAEASQGAAVDFVKGAALSAVNQFYNTRNYGSTPQGQIYGKFLDYCVYRSTPFGEQFMEQSAINSVDSPLSGLTGGNKWSDGSMCRDHSEMISNFRVYTALVSAEEALEGDVSSSGSSTATGSSSASSAVSGTPSGKCPAGTTKDYGIQKGYDHGTEKDIATCGILNWPANFPNSTGEKGEKIIEVNAAIAGDTVNLANAMKAAGVEYASYSSIGFRTFEQQKCIYDYYKTGVKGCSIFNTRPGDAARPGYSNHQMGYSIDLDGSKGTKVGNWLDANMSKFGFSRDVYNSKGSDYGHMTHAK